MGLKTYLLRLPLLLFLPVFAAMSQLSKRSMPVILESITLLDVSSITLARGHKAHKAYKAHKAQQYDLDFESSALLVSIFICLRSYFTT